MKTTSLLVCSLLSAALCTVCGCNTPQKFEDVSSRPAYRAYIGAKYELQVAMHISGVNAPPGYEKTVDYYVINPTTPSWSGPELISRDTLAPGTEIMVDSVRRCTNCPFEEVVSAEVRISGDRGQFSRPIHIGLKYLAPDFAKKKNEPNQSPQRNAGSRPSSGDSSASEAPSSLGPRG